MLVTLTQRTWLINKFKVLINLKHSKNLLWVISLNGRDPSLFSYLPSSVCCFSLCFRNGPDVDISFNNVSHISEASPLVDVGNFRTILPEIKLEVSISSIIPVSSLAQQMDGKHDGIVNTSHTLSELVITAWKRLMPPDLFAIISIDYPKNWNYVQRSCSYYIAQKIGDCLSNCDLIGDSVTPYAKVRCGDITFSLFLLFVTPVSLQTLYSIRLLADRGMLPKWIALYLHCH